MITALELSRNEKEHIKRAYYAKYFAGFFEKIILQFNVFISFEVFKKYNF